MSVRERIVNLTPPRAEGALSINNHGHMKCIAVFISCDSFEGFYGGTFGLDRESFIKFYRNDFVWDYVESLRRYGHTVIIYILSYGKAELRQLSDDLSIRFLPLPFWLRAIDSVLYRLRNLRYGTSLRDKVAHLGYGSALESALCRDNIDVIYHQEIWTSRFDIITLASKIPVVGADQGAVYADWMESTKRRSVARARYVLCQSTASLERALSFGGEALLMYNGVRTDFFTPIASDKIRPKIVLTVGRLVEEQKRFSDLLRAIQRLPDFSLILVGSGPDEGMLKQLAAQLDVEDRVNFLGFVKDREKLKCLYQECGVFVSTSSWEAVALVVLEAMSCGMPVVATRIPSFEDLFTDGTDGLLIPVGEPDSVASAIQTAYRNQFEFGRNARNTVLTRYSSQALYDRLASLIEAI